MPSKKEGQGRVSRVNFWLGWIVPFAVILLFLQVWTSAWAYMPYVGGDLSYLAYVFIFIAFTALVMHFIIPKRHPDLRFNMYFVMIFAFIVAIRLLLNVYFNWDNLVWF
jgi:uncharacterized membrane protein YhaH (DUF805 family)